MNKPFFRPGRQPFTGRPQLMPSRFPATSRHKSAVSETDSDTGIFEKRKRRTFAEGTFFKRDVPEAAKIELWLSVARKIRRCHEKSPVPMKTVLVI
jgi:hypothetical protein